MRRASALGLLTFTVVAGTIVGPITAAAGGACYHGSNAKLTQARAGADTFSAAIDECAFAPVVVYVDEGATIEWTNKDPFQHTVTGAVGAWGSENVLNQGDTIAQTFNREGVFPFYCMLHPSMVGAVVVGDPDPADIPVKTAAVGNVGIELGGTGSDGEGEAAAAQPASDGDAASDSTSGPMVVGTIAVLGLAAAVAVVLVRRRSHLQQSV